MIHLTIFFILLVNNNLFCIDFLCFEVTYVHLNQSEGTEILTKGSSAHLCIVFSIWEMKINQEWSFYELPHLHYIFNALHFIKNEILLETAEFCFLKLTFKWSCLKG